MRDARLRDPIDRNDGVVHAIFSQFERAPMLFVDKERRILALREITPVCKEALPCDTFAGEGSSLRIGVHCITTHKTAASGWDSRLIRNALKAAAAASRICSCMPAKVVESFPFQIDSEVGPARYWRVIEIDSFGTVEVFHSLETTELLVCRSAKLLLFRGDSKSWLYLRGYV